MPETAMNKYHSLIMGENDVGLTGKCVDMQAVSKPFGQRVPFGFRFRFSVFATYPRHHAAAMARSTMSAISSDQSFSSSALVNGENSALGIRTTVEVPPVIA